MKGSWVRGVGVIVVVLLLSATPAHAQGAQLLVSNVQAQQRQFTAIWDVTYDLETVGDIAVAVSLFLSTDSGETYPHFCATATGDVGAGVLPGTGKHIVWDAGAEFPGLSSTTCRLRVTADDGQAIKIHDSGMFAATPALIAAGIAQDALIYMVDCWPAVPATPDYGVVDVSHVAELGRQARLAGKTRVIVDIEYLPANPTSVIWNLQDSNQRQAGIAAWITFWNAFQQGYQHFGQVSMYDGFPNYIEVHRKIYENYPPYGEFGYETQRARDLQWQLDLAPLVQAMDFVTLSQYGPWETLDPASLIPPRHPKAVWQQIIDLAIRDSYSELQRVHGFTPVSFFFTTNQPAVYFGGGDGGGDGVLEFPADILQWNFDRVIEHVPAGLREVNMWQGPAPYRGYWSAAEIETMIKYGGASQ